MYIKKLIYENVGPIEQVAIAPSFTPEGNPKPIILVGENGTGKSTILSNIVDSFYEMARQAYEDAWQYTDNGHQYYKSIRQQISMLDKRACFPASSLRTKDKRMYIYVKVET